jgi:hypothetical protein
MRGDAICPVDPTSSFEYRQRTPLEHRKILRACTHRVDDERCRESGFGKGCASTALLTCVNVLQIKKASISDWSCDAGFAAELRATRASSRAIVWNFLFRRRNPQAMSRASFRIVTCAEVAPTDLSAHPFRGALRRAAPNRAVREPWIHRA